MHDSETPAVGQQVITACAFIHKEDNGVAQVFLGRRAPTKKFLPNEYELPGGHIEYGEDIKEGLAREVMEEFNTRVSIGYPFAVFTYINKIKGSHSVEIIYFAKFIDPIEDIKANGHDHSEYGWFSKDQIYSLTSSVKSVEDDEFQSIFKGFDLLSGRSLNIGGTELLT